LPFCSYSATNFKRCPQPNLKILNAVACSNYTVFVLSPTALKKIFLKQKQIFFFGYFLALSVTALKNLKAVANSSEKIFALSLTALNKTVF
jgi:hypothetical protein